MKCFGYVTLFLMLSTSAALASISPPPPGTVLPAMLSTKLNSHSKPGQQVRAVIMQDVPLPEGKIPEHSKLIGRVLSVAPDKIVVQFDSLHVRHQVISVSLSLRAIADPMEVGNARTPTTGPDYGTAWSEWDTVQIGGEAAYRGSVLVDDGDVVGKVLMDGSTLAPLESSPHGCLASDTTQALWVFSSDACGVYGYPELTIAHAGRKPPVGEIALQFQGKPLVRGGSGLLLRVVSTKTLD